MSAVSADTFGAVNVILFVLALLNVIGGPVVCVHANVNGLPSGS